MSDLNNYGGSDKFLLIRNAEFANLLLIRAAKS